jgi:predicted RND superfamily exporter protein
MSEIPLDSSPVAPAGDFWDRYASWVERRRAWILVVALLLTAVGGVLASRLPLKADFSELLPEQAPSVRILNQIQERMGGISTLVVAVEGGDWKARQQFVERAVELLRARIPSDQLSYIDYKITDARKHFEDKRYLYVDLEDLVKLRDRLKAKIEDERRRKLIIDLEDRPPYEFQIDDIKKKYEDKVADYDHFPDGYFITPDRTLQALLLRVPQSGMADAGTEDLVRRVKSVLSEIRPQEQGYQILIGGDPVTALEERAGIVEDLVVVSVSCILLIILSIVLYYRSARSVLLIAAPVAVGVAIAFGLGYLVVGSLNSNTAFLGSIIAGNGINFAIIMLARYIEERRHGHTFHLSLRVALRATWLATATAALAASIAYGSLMITDFRGFSQFGFIGGIGMIFCWLATFTVTPALLISFEARWPLKATRLKHWAPHLPGRISAFLQRHHLALATGGIVLTIGSLVGAAFFYADPYEYDFRKLRSRRAAETGSSALGARVDKIFHGTRFMAGSPAVILVDRPEQVAPLVEAVKRKKEEMARVMRSPVIGHPESILDLIPKDQEAKIPLLNEIRDLLDKKAIGWMTPEQKKEAEKYRPPDNLRPIRAEDLPAMLLRPFQEKDGTLGRIVYVYPAPGVASFEGKRLLAFAEAIREVQIAPGEVIRTSGREIVLADILEAVLHDGPIATLASFVGVLLLVTFAFRRFRDRAMVLATLVTGVSWMVGAAALMGVKVNMLNFVVLPITFGIGVDYPVNVYRRYSFEGPGAMGKVLWSTGGAVALCSLTTVIGFTSLLFADTQALSSFGLLAVIGEITTLAAALLWLPALTHIADRKHFEELEAAQAARATASLDGNSPPERP